MAPLHLSGLVAPARRLGSRITSRTRSAAGGRPTPGDPVARAHDVLADLEGAREVLEGGWVQGAWYTATGVGGREVRSTGPIGGGTGRSITGACLVGAVVRTHLARHPGSVAADAGPTLDVLWESLHEPAPTGPAAPSARLTRCAPPRVRAVRVRELTWWNDRPQRTRGDALGLLDQAISRTIFHLMAVAPLPEVPAAGAGSIRADGADQSPAT